MRNKFLAELIGTFGISFSTIALSASSKLSGGSGSLPVVALSAGLSVVAMIYTFGHISSAHFNPAVTLGFAISGRFPWKHLPLYTLAQLVGAFLAAGATSVIYGSGSHGIHVPAPTASLASTLLLEAVLSFILMIVIMSVATDKQAPKGFAGLAIGATVVFLILVGGPLSGASMNPARSLGPALFAGGPALSHWWIYLIGPCVGTMLGARTYEVIRTDHKK